MIEKVTVGIILARGGSKEIPGKNLKRVGGRALVERAILTARNSKCDVIILSSDSQEILDYGNNLNIRTHLRSGPTSADIATSESAVLEIINDMGSNWHEESILCLIQPTSPFIDSRSINECVDSVFKGTSAFTGVPANSFMWELKQDTWVEIGHNRDQRLPRQSLSAKVIESGACYAFQLSDFLRTKSRFSLKVLPILIEAPKSLEIDKPEDLVLAEALSDYILCDWEGRVRTKESRQPLAIITDFDGCLTDDSVLTDSLGNEIVKVTRKDGLYIKLIRQRFNIPTIVVSTEKNEVVRMRCQKLDIECHSGVEEKSKFIESWLKDHGLSWHEIWYVGNDLNDLEPIKRAGLGICPKDSNLQVKKGSGLILQTAGGYGIFSEIFKVLREVEK